MELKKLVAKVTPLLDSQFEQRMNRLNEQFGTANYPQGSSDLNEIKEAAIQGRVETLLLSLPTGNTSQLPAMNEVLIECLRTAADTIAVHDTEQDAQPSAKAIYRF